MRIFCLSFLFLFVNNNLLSQDNCEKVISGKVLDIEKNEPLSGVLIRIFDSENFTISDDKGNFFLEDLCSDQIKVNVSRYGYYDTIFDINNENSIIYLTQETFELRSVLIQDKKEKKSGTQTISQQSLNLDQKQIDPTMTLASIVSEIDGVTFTSAGSNVELPVIHGLYGNRVLILNNYLKHGFQNWGNQHAPEINTSSISNISVIKGASGVRFGPEALGGVIIVEPDPMKLNNPYYINISSGYQTNGKGKNFNFKAGNGYKNWGYFLGFDYIKIGDRHTPSYSLTNSGKNEKSINFGLHYHLKNFDIKLYYNYVDLNLALLRSSVFHSGNALSQALNSDTPLFIRPFSYSINEPNQLAKHHFAKANINWWYNENEKISLTVGSQINKRKEFDVRRNSFKPIINLDLFTYDYLLEWDHSFYENINGLIGLHYFNQDNDNNPGTGTTPFIPNYNTNRFSFYLIEAIKINNSLLEFGVRFDTENYNVRGRETNQNIFRDENSFTNVTFSLGYEREVSENISIRSNLGSAWRTPNMAELYSFGSHGFKTTFGLLRYYNDDNDKIKTDKVLGMDDGSSPEKSLKFINEVDFSRDKNDLKITLFSNYILNYVFERPIGLYGTVRGPMPYFVFDQSDIVLVGSDLYFQRKFSTKFKSSLRLNYLWSQNLIKNGKMINQPPIRIANNLMWNTKDFWKINHSEISISPSYTFRQFQSPMIISPDELISGLIDVNLQSDIFDFKDAPDGYFLIDFAWKFKIADFSASVEVKNLLNKKYRNYLNEMRYFADEMGRNFLFNISYRISKK